jgi:hypothetical protein
MTIAQALKEKNKKAANITKLWQKISSYNSVIEGSEKPYDIEKLWGEYNLTVAELIDLKTRIHHASEPIRKDIFAMSELKSTIQNLRSLNTQSGLLRDRYGNEPTTLVAHFSTLWKDNQIELTEKEIDSIQEKLDAFNHTTQI